jgi:hypothetical protein
LLAFVETKGIVAWKLALRQPSAAFFRSLSAAPMT